MNTDLDLSNFSLAESYQPQMAALPKYDLPSLDAIQNSNSFGNESLAEILKNMQNQQMNPWQKFGMGANALTGLLGAYAAMKGLSLQKKQFNLNKSLANRNLANSATAYNSAARDKANMSAQMTGNAYGSLAYQNASDRFYNPVDGSPIR